ncbi:hypothetical protein QYF36_000592 [Acer negundo]|nr:hypothetical protein QYF36_000592 [Acer negundo]
MFLLLCLSLYIKLTVVTTRGGHANALGQKQPCLILVAHAEQAEFPSAERFNYLLDVLNNGSTSNDKMRHISTNYNDQDSHGLNLPESPFASPIRNGISTVI